MGKYIFIEDSTTEKKEIGECNGKIVKFLRNMPLVNPRIEINGKNIKNGNNFNISDNYIIKEEDVILIVNEFKGGGLGSVIRRLADPLGFASKTLNYVLGGLLNPEKPSIPTPTEQRKAETEFSINTAQNQARTGQPIPEGFGTFIEFPDLITAQYRRYENNDQFLYMLLCVGVGENTINNVFIEDTNVNSFTTGDFTYRSYKTPSSHTGNDKIKDDWNNEFSDPYFRDIVITAREIQNRKVTVSEPFNLIQINPSGTLTDRLEFDILFPNGLTNNNNTTSVEIRFTYEKSDGTQTVVNETITENTINPIRRTFGYSVAPGYYKAKVERITEDSDSSNIRDEVFIETMKAYLINNDVTGNGFIDYGNITLLAVKIKATQGISERGQVKVKVNATRDNITTIENVMNYIWSSDNGGRQPSSKLDLPDMPEPYNAVIRDRTTVFKTLQSVSTSRRYNFYSVFNAMTSRKDVPQANRTMMFSEVNINQGTLRISLSTPSETDYNGVKVIYSDAETFDKKEKTYPLNSTFPEEIEINGLTDDVFAEKQAQFLYEQARFRNIKYEFDTELDGFIPSLYDRCGLSHPALDMSQSGVIVSFTDNTVTLNETVKENYTNPRIIFRGPNGEPSVHFNVVSINARTITIDISDNPLPSWLYIGDDKQKTMYQIGEGIDYVKDIIVTSIRPKRNNIVSITAWNYNETIYN